MDMEEKYENALKCRPNLWDVRQWFTSNRYLIYFFHGLRRMLNFIFVYYYDIIFQTSQPPGTFSVPSPCFPCWSACLALPNILFSYRSFQSLPRWYTHRSYTIKVITYDCRKNEPFLLSSKNKSPICEVLASLFVA